MKQINKSGKNITVILPTLPTPSSANIHSRMRLQCYDVGGDDENNISDQLDVFFVAFLSVTANFFFFFVAQIKAKCQTFLLASMSANLFLPQLIHFFFSAEMNEKSASTLIESICS